MPKTKEHIVKIVKVEDESVAIYLDDERIAYADHDSHGFDGMDLIGRMAERVANLLGIRVIHEYDSGDYDELWDDEER